ncbi:uncharacterized protein BP5553_01833 [Venustampulla echinocandica]|uniref:Uncharacterized protein n=1 Tax=Venustampulla echinocandica TaxID=2656787 RepID=A0A370U249_9HELO|nr:uncharacterized protein BP5553_01833 [Venustampulla echinocandica]RDL41854.1 hypothetical protein BP5553_01833 [Venustampulla echinocandica]
MLVQVNPPNSPTGADSLKFFDEGTSPEISNLQGDTEPGSMDTPKIQADHPPAYNCHQTVEYPEGETIGDKDPLPVTVTRMLSWRINMLFWYQGRMARYDNKIQETRNDQLEVDDLILWGNGQLNHLAAGEEPPYQRHNLEAAEFLKAQLIERRATLMRKVERAELELERFSKMPRKPTMSEAIKDEVEEARSDARDYYDQIETQMLGIRLKLDIVDNVYNHSSREYSKNLSGTPVSTSKLISHMDMLNFVQHLSRTLSDAEDNFETAKSYIEVIGDDSFSFCQDYNNCVDDRYETCMMNDTVRETVRRWTKDWMTEMEELHNTQNLGVDQESWDCETALRYWRSMCEQLQSSNVRDKWNYWA